MLHLRLARLAAGLAATGLTALLVPAGGVLGRLLGLVLGLLRRLRGHDAVIMLRMLKIILGRHPVAAGIGVAGELEIFFIDMRGRAANLHLGSRGVEGAVGIEAAAAVSTAAAAATTTTATIMLRPAAASA